MLAELTRELSAAGLACRIVGALPATRRLISMAYLTDHLQLDGVPDSGPSGRGAGRRTPQRPPAGR